MLVARAFRHILQHGEAILDGALAVRRHALPFRVHIVFNMIPLRLRKTIPVVRAVIEILALLRSQIMQSPIIFQNFLLLLR